MMDQQIHLIFFYLFYYLFVLIVLMNIHQNIDSLENPMKIFVDENRLYVITLLLMVIFHFPFHYELKTNLYTNKIYNKKNSILHTTIVNRRWLLGSS
jgi:hypothetical protein